MDKNRIKNFIIFLILWGIIYWLIKFNFVVLALIISYMLVYFRSDKKLYDGTVFLAKEFDKHHDALARELYEVKQSHDFLIEEYKLIREKLEKLEENK